MKIKNVLTRISLARVVLALASCSTIATLQAQDRLYWFQPYPVGQDFHDISVAPTGEAYAITHGGLLVRYSVGRFETFDTGLYGFRASVYAVARDDVYVSVDGMVLRFDGSSFRELPGIDEFVIRSIWADSSGSVVAVGDIGGDFGGIYRLTDGTWIAERAFEDPPLQRVIGVGRELYAVGGMGTILRYDGQGWRRVPAPTDSDLNDIYGNPDAGLYAVGTSRTVLRLRGNDWVRVPLPSGEGDDLTGVVTTNELVWATFANGYLLYFDGTAWKELPVHDEIGLRAIRAEALSARFYAVGDRGNFLQGSRDSFSILSRDVTSTDLYSAAAFGSREAIWVGAGGAVLRSKGLDLRIERSPTDDDLISVHGLSGNDVFASSANGTIIRFDGAGWKTSRSPEQGECGLLTECEFLIGIRQVTAESVYAVGYSVLRGSLFLHWDGSTWRYFSPVAEPAGIPIAIWSSAPDNVFIVGTGGMVLHFNGVSWSQTTLTDEDLIAVQGASDGHVYALTPSALYSYREESWERQAVNPAAEELGDLTALGVSAAGRVYVATAASVVLSLDGSVLQPSTFAPIWPIYSLLPVDEGEVYVSGALGNIILYGR